METTKKENTPDYFTTLDSYVAGYLKYKGHSPEIYEQNGKFVFCFPQTEKLAQDLQDFQNGATINALQFTMAIKSLKGKIHFERERKTELRYGYNK